MRSRATTEGNANVELGDKFFIAARARQEQEGATGGERAILTTTLRRATRGWLAVPVPRPNWAAALF